MNRKRSFLLAVLIITFFINCVQPAQAEAKTSSPGKVNTMNDILYTGQDWLYQFSGIGKIKKVTLSNKKVISYKAGDYELKVTAKAAGKTKITVVGTSITYTINLTVKKMDVTAKLCDKLQDGSYLMKITNNTKEGIFENIIYSVILRDSGGEFLDWDEENNVAAITPGATVYTVYWPNSVGYSPEEVDLSESTIEITEIDRKPPGSGYVYVDDTSKIKMTDSKNGVLAPDQETTFKLKNNGANRAEVFAQIYWYDKAGNIVAVDEESCALESKETKGITVRVPEKAYGAVSYGISVRAYHRY